VSCTRCAASSSEESPKVRETGPRREQAEAAVLPGGAGEVDTPGPLNQRLSGPVGTPAPSAERVAIWQRARNILYVRLDTIGDIIMSTPAIRALSASAPARRITLLTSSRGASAGRLVPEVGEVIVYDPPWMKATAPRLDAMPDYVMAERLRRLRFDAAVIATTYTQSALPAAFLTYLAGIPLRLAHARENPYQLLTDWVPETEPERHVRHEVRRQLDLVASVGATTGNERLSFRVSPAALARVRGLLTAAGVGSTEPYIVVHPGASASSRRYRPDGFAEVVRRLTDEDRVQVVFSGDAADQALIAHIQTEAGVDLPSLAGALRLEDLGALLAGAALLISNNTAPVHIAGATGTPVVDLYALTNPQHGPWMVPHRTLSHDVSCKYCYKSVCPMKHHDCLRLVQPEQVLQAARELAPLSGVQAA
jgi:lipopolysaccharide heptosyltransferase II